MFVHLFQCALEYSTLSTHIHPPIPTLHHSPIKRLQTGWWQWCEAVAMDQGNSVWATAPTLFHAHKHAHTHIKPSPTHTPPPLSAKRAMTHGPSDSAPQTCLFLSQQWQFACCRTPMHSAHLRGCLRVHIHAHVRAYSNDRIDCACGLEWQCHLLITRPMSRRQRFSPKIGWVVSAVRSDRYHKYTHYQNKDSTKNCQKELKCPVAILACQELRTLRFLCAPFLLFRRMSNRFVHFQVRYLRLFVVVLF